MPSPLKLQFSLRELLFFVAIAALILYAALGDENWRREHTLPGIIENRQTAFSRDDTRIINYQPGIAANVFDVATGQPLLTIKGDIRAVALSPDGTRAAVGTRSGSLEIWNVTGQKLHTLPAHTASISSVAFSENGQRLISASADTTAIVWDPTSGQRLAELKGHAGLIHRAHLSADGATALTESTYGWGMYDPSEKTIWGDKTDRIWDVATAREVKQGRARHEKTLQGTVSHRALLNEDYRQYTRDADTTADGHRTLIRQSFTQPVALFDLASREFVFEFEGCAGREVNFLFSHRENIVAAGLRDTQIWRCLVSSKYNRVARWWAIRLIPILLIGYCAYRFFQWRTRPKQTQP